MGDAITQRGFVVDIGIAAEFPKASNRDALDLQLSLRAYVRTLGKAEDMFGVETRYVPGALGLGLLGMGDGGKQECRGQNKGKAPDVRHDRVQSYSLAQPK